MDNGADRNEKKTDVVSKPVGRVQGIDGSVLLVRGLDDSFLGEQVSNRENRLIGEVLAFRETGAVVACYAGVQGIAIGDAIEGTGSMLSVQLGPGLESSRYDGLLRPLEPPKGCSWEDPVSKPAATTDKRWYFAPSVLVGDELTEGNMLGEAKNGGTLRYRVLVPCGIFGTVAEMHSGERRPQDGLVKLKDGRDISMIQSWPLRKPRPFAKRLPLGERVKTGQDGLASLSVGGSLTLRGLGPEQRIELIASILSHHAFDLAIVACCGLSGITWTQLSENVNMLGGEAATSSDRVVWVVATADAPLAQLQIAPSSAMVLAEFYRDMGYSILVVIDDLARWDMTQARLLGQSSRLGSEEGTQPPFLGRAGRVACLGGLNRIGAVTALSFRSTTEESSP